MFANKTIVITGASTGIGEATAKLFAKEGANVFNLDVMEPNYHDPLIQFLPCDISKFSDTANAFQKVLSTANKIDYLFANAGVHIFANIEDTTLEDLDRIIDINLKGIFYSLKCALPIMKKQKFGSIVLTGSDQSFIGKGESAAYGATKGAISQLTKSTAIDYAKYNIRVNCICPGTIDTPLYHHAVKQYSSKSGIAKDSVYAAMNSAQPLARIGSPEEVAHLVEFLFSDKSSFITGSLLSVDGGFVAQ